MQQRAQLLAPDGREDRVRRLMRRGRAARYGCDSLGIACLEGIADGLIVATQGLGDQPGVLAPHAGQEHLAAPQDKGLGRPQARLKGRLFGRSQGTAIDRFSHVQ